MRNTTRKLFEQYNADVAEANGVTSLEHRFTVEPSIAQDLEDVVHEEVGFLKRINSTTVEEQQGDKLGLDADTMIASTTDTDLKDRECVDPSGLELIDTYFCTQTNFDTFIKYQKLDKWAKFENFGERIGRHLAKTIGRNRISIGWHGINRAATSNRALNPLGQDVNKGWLQKIRDWAEHRILSEGEQEPGEIRVGKDGDYENIDSLVYDLVEAKIHEQYQDDTDLVCIIGRELLHDKYLGLIDTSNIATERVALDVIMTTKQVAGIPAVRVPFFPKRGILITKFDNLSIYLQENTLRRNQVENSKRDRIDNYISRNECYVVEDYSACGMAESDNIKVKNKAGEWV